MSYDIRYCIRETGFRLPVRSRFRSSWPLVGEEKVSRYDTAYVETVGERLSQVTLTNQQETKQPVTGTFDAQAINVQKITGSLVTLTLASLATWSDNKKDGSLLRVELSVAQSSLRTVAVLS